MVNTKTAAPTRKPLKVAITGTHSTGKSTLLAALAEVLAEHHLTVATVADLGSEALATGFPILYDHTPQSTLWIITRGVSMELKAELSADVILVDRPVCDALAYYEAALAYRSDDGDPPWSSYLLDITAHHSKTYDLIYKTVLAPDVPLGRAKPRDSDQRFRYLADSMVVKTLGSLELPYEDIETARFAPYDLADKVARKVTKLRAGIEK